MLLSMLAAGTAAFYGVFKWFGPGSEQHQTVGPPPGEPSASPSPSPSASPSPEPNGEANDTEPKLSFMILSDLHINSGISEPSDKLRKALDDVQSFEPKIETLLITGDVTDAGTDADYREYNKVMKSYKNLPPVHANMGNHDYYTIWIDKDGQWNKDAMPNGKTDEQTRQTFMKQFGIDKVYHDFTVNGYHFIMLSQETYVQEKPEVGEGAWYSDEQMNWFRERLAKHKDDSKPVFVMIHQPLPAIGQDGGSHRLIRAKEFREILKPYKNVFVFSGHQHQDFRNGNPHYAEETFHWFMNASVGRTMNRSYQQEKKATSQGLFVQVHGDKVVLRGREFMDGSFIKEADWTVKLKSAKV